MRSERLKWLVKADGPFASIYFDDSHDTADASRATRSEMARHPQTSRVPRRERGSHRQARGSRM